MPRVVGAGWLVEVSSFDDLSLLCVVLFLSTCMLTGAPCYTVGFMRCHPNQGRLHPMDVRCSIPRVGGYEYEWPKDRLVRSSRSSN